jgi:hypothetical protein
MDEARYAIQTLLTLPHAARVLAGHRWSHEVGRWQELIHCLLEATLSQPSKQVRELTARLAFLGLLTPEAWADDRRAATDARMRTVLASVKVTPKEAEKAIVAVGEAAGALTREFDGKIQKALRAVGEDALAYLTHRFALESLSRTEQRAAFTAWLQSVCNLPILDQHSAIEAYCRAHKITRDDLVGAADAMDLSVGALGDLIHVWAATERPKS